MTRFRLVTTWLLLLVPTLLLGAGALYLLKGEEARIESRVRAAAHDRVAAIAGNIELAIGEVRDGMMETLAEQPQQGLGTLADHLEDWKRSNPLVRNVFIWEKGRGLGYPDPERPSSDEEAAFIRRYLPLFSDQSEWQEPPDDKSTPSVEQVSSILFERKELRQLAKQSPVATDYAAQPASVPVADSVKKGTGGWRPWFADNRLHLLGWYERGDGLQKIGVEVEMMALLSRLLSNFPSIHSIEESYALVDGNGDLFHQVGHTEISSEHEALAKASVGGLPHWSVVAYPNADAGKSASAFHLIAFLLVGTFVVAILSGGSLLLWQAHRNQLDARQKTSFVSNVSHELKTPLTTIRLYAELLDEKRTNDVVKEKKYLKTIIKESERLTRLVNNVLDFSRLEQGRKNFAKGEFDLVELLSQILDSQQVRIEDAGMKLIRNMERAPVLIQSDRDAFEQIVLNLIDNAIKYASEGGMLIVEASQGQKDASVRIKDKGPGIPAGHRNEIFKKFHRVDDSLTANKQGSGLGLSIAKQLTEGIGGSLGFCPREGGGSCFEIRLPSFNDTSSGGDS